MALFSRFQRGNLHLTRIEAFSDGVFAIIVTLLVLELKVPGLVSHTSVPELRDKLLEQLPKFLSWMISFIIVCKFWLNHNHLLSMAKHANYALAWLNSIFLMFQSFIPFPTGLMGEYPDNPLAVSCFGIVMTVNTLLFILLRSYLVKHMLKPELVGKQDPKATLKGVLSSGSYLLGAAAAWVSLPLAFVVYALTPLFFITPAAPYSGEEK